MKMRRLSAAPALALVLWSRLGWALCPNCIGQRSAITPTLELVGLFLLVPFAVVAVVVRLMRRAIASSQWPAPAAPASVPPSAPADGAGGGGGVHAG